MGRARFLGFQGDQGRWRSDTKLPPSIEAGMEGVCWVARDGSLHRLAPSHAPRVFPEMTSQRLGLHLNVDTRRIIVHCPANLTLRLSDTFMNGNCNVQVSISTGSSSCSKPAKPSHPKAILSRGSPVLSRLRRSEAYVLQLHIDPLEV